MLPTVKKRHARAYEVNGHDFPGTAKMPAGAFYFMHSVHDTYYGLRASSERIGIVHGCPCGCGARGPIWFKGGSLNGTGGAPESEWEVTGDWPQASLTPSIGFAKDKVTGKYHWHGYLKNGVFVEE